MGRFEIGQKHFGALKSVPGPIQINSEVWSTDEKTTKRFSLFPGLDLQKQRISNSGEAFLLCTSRWNIADLVGLMVVIHVRWRGNTMWQVLSYGEREFVSHCPAAASSKPVRIWTIGCWYEHLFHLDKLGWEQTYKWT